MRGKGICVALLAIVFLFGVPVSGYCVEAFTSGNDLVEWMREYEKAASGGSNINYFQVGLYMGFVSGVVDNILITVVGEHPIAKNWNFDGVTTGQFAAVVAKYLKVNPEKWHAPAAFLVIGALDEAFPAK